MMQVDYYSYENLDFEQADRVLAEVRTKSGSAGGVGADA
jgi:hypothetical protein